MEQVAEDFCSDVPVKKSEHSGLCELFLTGAAGQKDQQIVPFIFGWVLSAGHNEKRHSVFGKNGKTLKEDKNNLNKQKHRISFETAAFVFEDPFYIEIKEWSLYYDQNIDF